MGREVRRVPKDWQHPKDEGGNYIQLLEGYEEDKEEFLSIFKKQGLQEALEWMGAPNKDDYMPEWPEEEKTHIQMYQNVSEGTPISPVMDAPENLARWLADNNASAFGSSTATYEQWLNMIKLGHAMSMVITDGEIKSGVEFLTNENPN